LTPDTLLEPPSRALRAGMWTASLCLRMLGSGRYALGDFIGTWKENEPRVSRLVFIGRNLNRPQLRRGFESCTVD